MEMLAAIHEMFDHNYWARDRQLEVCATLTEEQFSRQLGGSFPSLRETFAHMAAVEWLWLERWRGASPRKLIPAEEFPTLAAVKERWNAIEKELRAWLDGLDEEGLSRTVTCISTRGEPWTFPMWRMLVHLTHHQGYHRGQATNFFRMLGVQPPRIDFLLLGRDAKFANKG